MNRQQDLSYLKRFLVGMGATLYEKRYMKSAAVIRTYQFDCKYITILVELRENPKKDGYHYDIAHSLYSGPVHLKRVDTLSELLTCLTELSYDVPKRFKRNLAIDNLLNS